jgi:Ca2+-binding RTX toxin-like protein
MSISVTGTVPATILENDRPEDWVAILRVPANTIEVVLTGTDAVRFTATTVPRSGVVEVRPAAVMDAEALGHGATFTFGLQARNGGGWRTAAQTWTVTLQGVDDTPPERLRFRTGGSVLAHDIGAEIGLLDADDADTDGGLEYSVAWPDAARFDIVDGMLRLRPGVDLLAEAGTTIEVAIEVSDGRNWSAMLLSVTVLAPGPAYPRPIQDGTFAADRLEGSAGTDALFGHVGADTLLGGEGDDELDGGTGDDSLDGGAGADSLRGGAGRDTLNGIAGDDWLQGGEDADSLVGANGNDALEGGAGPDTLRAGTGHDTLRGGDDADMLDGSQGDDLLDGDAGTDSLAGGDGADTLAGGDGADTLDGGGGGDTLAGGLGDDTYILAAPDAAWREDADGGLDTLVIGWALTIPLHIERLLLRAGSGDLALTGSAGPETLVGNEGGNTLLGLAGEDLLLGEAGGDLLEGGAGNDLLGGGAGADTLWGGAEDDRAFGGDAADWLEGGPGHDSLFGGPGPDTLLGGEGPDLLDGGEGGDSMLGQSGADTLLGGAGDDVLRVGTGGGEGAALPLLRGGPGNDTLDAASDGRGSLLIGDEGDDMVFIDHPLDQVLELPGGGRDTVQATISSGFVVLPAWVEALVLLGQGGGGIGNEQDNRITGNVGPNLLFGGAGADTLVGGGGADTLIGGAGADSFILVQGGAVSVLLDFDVAQDRLLLQAQGGALLPLDAADAPVLILPPIAPETFLPSEGGGIFYP